jgi:hypothetical protein
MSDFTLFRTSVTHQIASDVLAAEWASVGRYRLRIVCFQCCVPQQGNSNSGLGDNSARSNQQSRGNSNMAPRMEESRTCASTEMQLCQIAVSIVLRGLSGFRAIVVTSRSRVSRQCSQRQPSHRKTNFQVPSPASSTSQWHPTSHARSISPISSPNKELHTPLTLRLC